MIISQSLDWLFCAVKVPDTKGVCKKYDISEILLGRRSLGEGVSDSLFFGDCREYIYHANLL